MSISTIASEPRAQSPATGGRFISVIVPVRNEGAFLGRTLEQLLGMDYEGGFEVLVVDGGSSDGTRDVVRDLMVRHTNLRLFDNPLRLSSAARNVGVRHARGDLVVVVDGHCELEGPDYLRHLAEAFERSGADCVGRPQPLDVPGASPLQRGIAAARSCWLGHHPASHIYSTVEQFVRPQSVAVAYRRSLFDEVGLFDETFDACEDVEFNHRVDRAGLNCFFTPKVRVLYHPRTTLAGLFRQMMRYGRGRVRLFRKHPETLSPSCLVPAAFAAGLAMAPALVLAPRWLALGYAACLLTYLLAVLATSLRIALRPGNLRLMPWLPVIFPAIHLGAGTGVLLELAHGPARRR